jgi:catechol 2,3-dioxygenase-like lactoylglutathione lyase family enzyme
MLDHIGLNVSDYKRSRDFYARALAPLGFSLLMEPVPRTGGFGHDGRPWSGSARGIRELYHPTYYAA